MSNRQITGKTDNSDFRDYKWRNKTYEIIEEFRKAANSSKSQTIFIIYNLFPLIFIYILYLKKSSLLFLNGKRNACLF